MSEEVRTDVTWTDAQVITPPRTRARTCGYGNICRMPTRRDNPASPLAFGIGSVLSDVMRERALNGLEVAGLTGLDSSQVSRWKNGRVNISVEDLIVLCDGLGLDLREFLTEARARAAAYEARTSR